MENTMLRTSFWSSNLLTAFIIGVLASGGCQSEETVCAQEDCGANLQELYSCKPLTAINPTYDCRDDDADAASWCSSIGGVKGAVKVACEDYAGDYGSDTGSAAPPWDPSSSVTYDSANDKYLVEDSFAATLK